MKLEFRLIEMFQEVMRRGSVTEAARILGVTQPVVSASLARLEKQLGFSLFVREGRHIAPTAEARLFGAEATRAMSGFEGLADVAASISAAARGSLTIATNPAPAISWLPPIVAGFQKARPDLRVRFISRSSKEVRELAGLDGFDVGLAEAPFIRQDNVVRRFRLRMVAAGHAERALAAHAGDGRGHHAGIRGRGGRDAGRGGVRVHRHGDRAGRERGRYVLGGPGQRPECHRSAVGHATVRAGHPLRGRHVAAGEPSVQPRSARLTFPPRPQPG